MARGGGAALTLTLALALALTLALALALTLTKAERTSGASAWSSSRAMSTARCSPASTWLGLGTADTNRIRIGVPVG